MDSQVSLLIAHFLLILKNIPISEVPQFVYPFTYWRIWSRFFLLTNNEKINKQKISKECFYASSLAVQWLRLYASTAGGMGSVPGQGTKIFQAARQGQKEKKKLDIKSWKDKEETKCILLSKRSQSEKATLCMTATLWHSEKDKTMETVQRPVVARD